MFGGWVGSGAGTVDVVVGATVVEGAVPPVVVVSPASVVVELVDESTGVSAPPPKNTNRRPFTSARAGVHRSAHFDALVFPALDWSSNPYLERSR